MTAPTRVLWCLVNYGTADLVSEFADAIHVASLEGADVDLRVAVADNSHHAELVSNQLPSMTTLVHRPDNPGYLPGALLAYQAAVQDHVGWEPDWVVISNADLDIPESFWEWLGVVGSDDRRCFAPQVYCEARKRNLNPHMRTRPSVLHVGSRWLFTRNRWLRRLMSRVADRRQRLAAEPVNESGGAPGSNRPLAFGEAVYACHGTIHVMPGKRVDLLLPELIDCPLYAEEFAFAEAFRRNGLSLHVVEGVLVRHRPHASTGQQDEATWFRRWRVAYDYSLRLRLRGDRSTNGPGSTRP